MFGRAVRGRGARGAIRRRRALTALLASAPFVFTSTAAAAIPVTFVASVLADVGIESTLVATVATFIVNTAISIAICCVPSRAFGPPANSEGRQEDGAA